MAFMKYSNEQYVEFILLLDLDVLRDLDNRSADQLKWIVENARIRKEMEASCVDDIDGIDPF